MRAVALILALALGGCASEGLTVTAKEYIYPRFNDAWLADCTVPPIPTPPTTIEKLLRFINAYETSLRECNAEKQAIRKVYSEFLGNLPKSE